MKKRIFLMLTLCALTCLAGKGYGSSVVCQNLPSSVTTGTSFLILFECNLAANSVPVGKSLRVTTNLHAVNSGTKGVTSCLYF